MGNELADEPRVGAGECIGVGRGAEQALHAVLVKRRGRGVFLQRLPGVVGHVNQQSREAFGVGGGDHQHAGEPAAEQVQGMQLHAAAVQLQQRRVTEHGLDQVIGIPGDVLLRQGHVGGAVERGFLLGDHFVPQRLGHRDVVKAQRGVEVFLVTRADIQRATERLEGLGAECLTCCAVGEGQQPVLPARIGLG